MNIAIRQVSTIMSTQQQYLQLKLKITHSQNNQMAHRLIQKILAIIIVAKILRYIMHTIKYKTVRHKLKMIIPIISKINKTGKNK
jgi:hypothetical protein